MGFCSDGKHAYGIRSWGKLIVRRVKIAGTCNGDARGDGGLPEMGGPGWEGMVVVDGGGAVVDVGGAGGEGDRAEVGKKGGVGKKKGLGND
ncbi:hypothetical protein E3N88_41433 [Mikania micrantha]|uniref:Uncharacterized protein n=1 Tax=Mikania micrantha TaxID=192012 RepID=A0A5N6LQN8_9ASTR|nr:hypothetical protein E3N88_41433 [Mikania micrantha]